MKKKTSRKFIIALWLIMLSHQKEFIKTVQKILKKNYKVQSPIK